MKHSSFDATISALSVETSAFRAATLAIAQRSLDAETSVFDAETSAIAQSFRRYRRGVSGDCRVGITLQMCNRVTNHGDMSTLSKPALAIEDFTFTLLSVWGEGLLSYCQIGKRTHFWKINIFAKTAVFVIWVPKSLNIYSEWGNINGCNKYPRAFLNVRGRGGQKRNSFLFCSNSQHDHSQLLMYQNASSWHDLVSFQHEL